MITVITVTAHIISGQIIDQEGGVYIILTVCNLRERGRGRGREQYNYTDVKHMLVQAVHSGAQYVLHCPLIRRAMFNVSS